MDGSALYVTSGPPDKAMYAVGVRLHYCDCDKFHVPPGSIVAAESHVSISRKIIEVGKSRSAAISYAWGQFQRQPILIGHLSDEGQSENPIPVTLELGREWEHAAFVEKLVYWSNQYEGIWIDQLCIPQEGGDSDRLVLASIPAVFRNFDMLLFRPGPRCKCLEAWLDADDSRENLYTVAFACFNAVDICSHFDRMWTLQEFRCAQNIRVVPVSPRVLPCARMIDGVEYDSLNPFIRLCIEEKLGKLPSNFEDVKGYVRSKIVFFVEGMIYTHHWKSFTTYNELQVARFWMADETLEITKREKQHKSKFDGTMSLMSATIEAEAAVKNHLKTDAEIEHSNANQEQENASPYEGHQQSPLSGAMNVISHLASVVRSNVRATQPKDYILSLWVDCPRYTIPRQYKIMSLPFLYEDAIKQYEGNFRARLLTFTPNGLFANTLPSSALRPTLFFKESTVGNADDVYGVFCKTSVPLRTSLSGHLRFCKAKEGCQPLLQKACLWTDPILGSTITERLAILEDTVRHWATLITHRAEPRLKRPSTQEDELIGRVRKRLLLLSAHKMLAARAQPTGSSVAVESSELDDHFNHTATPLFQFKPGDIAPVTDFVVRIIFRAKTGKEGISGSGQVLDSLPLSFCSDVAAKLAEAAFGMQPGTCDRHDLVPVATRDELGVPLLGLFKRDALVLGQHTSGGTQTLRFTDPFEGISFKEPVGEAIYEAVRVTAEDNFPRDVGDEHLPHYKVCGVWVPIQDQKGLSGAMIAKQDEYGNHGEYDMIVV